MLLSHCIPTPVRMNIQEILDAYNVSFVTELSGSRWLLSSGVLEEYFHFMRDVKNIEDDIIPTIDHYLNGNPFLIDNDISVWHLYVVVSPEGVVFADSDTNEHHMTVPLSDFRAIAQAWADYNK